MGSLQVVHTHACEQKQETPLEAAPRNPIVGHSRNPYPRQPPRDPAEKEHKCRVSNCVRLLSV